MGTLHLSWHCYKESHLWTRIQMEFSKEINTVVKLKHTFSLTLQDFTDLQESNEHTSTYVILFNPLRSLE